MKHNKGEILEIGMKLLWSNGYHVTGIQEILHNAGISKGSFYHFFENKKDFGMQAIEYYSKDVCDNLISPILSDTRMSPLNRIKSFYNKIKLLHLDTSCPSGCFLVNSSLELAGNDKDFAKVIHSGYNLWIDAIAKCIKEGQKMGEIKDDYDSNVLARHIHNTLSGYLVNIKMTSNFNIFDDFLKILIASLKK